MTEPVPTEDLLITLTGWNNADFVLAGDGEGDKGIKLATADLGTVFEDMYDAPVEALYTSTAFQIGGTYGGIREGMYEFQLAFNVRATPGTPWRINDSRFRKALSYKKDARIRVKVGDEPERYLVVRMRKSPKLKVKVDPNRHKYGLLLVTFVAPYPRWMQDDVTDQFVTTENHTVSGSEIGSVTVANPTSEEIWLKWMLQGGAGVRWSVPDHSWGDDRWDRAEVDEDRVIVMPELTAGENVRIDTDEMAMQGQVVSSTDTEIFQRMNGVEFLYPVPPYTAPTELPIAVSGADIGAGIQVRCPRPWARPWGMD